MKREYFKYGMLPLGFILFVGVCYLFLFSPKTEKANSSPHPQQYKISLQDTLVAGTPVCFSYEKWMNGCNVIIENSWGVGIQPINDDFTSVCIKDSLVFQSGLNSIILNCDGRVVTNQEFIVAPDLPQEPLETYLGSKSITADNGKHWAMITAIPVDKFKNAVANKTSVTFDLYRPNGEKQIVETQTENLVAYHKIVSGSKTGKTIVGSKVGNSGGQEKMLLEEAGYPENFEIKVFNKYKYADNRQFFKVETSIITDKFGNQVADGTLVNFLVIDANNEQRQLTAYTIEGIARLNILNPILEGNITIKASIYGDVFSNELSVFFEKLIDELPINYQKKQNRISIGPLVGPLGQYVPDGSEVKIVISPTDNYVDAVVVNGYANLDVSDLKTGLYDIAISFGGLRKTIKFKR